MKSLSTEPISLKNGQSRQTKTNISRRSQKNTDDITRCSLKQKRNGSCPREKMIMLLISNLTPLQSWIAKSIPSTQRRLTLLRSSSKRSRSRILVRISHVSVYPSCRVSKWTKSGNKPKEWWFTRGIGLEKLQVCNLVFGREDQA